MRAFLLFGLMLPVELMVSVRQATGRPFAGSEDFPNYVVIGAFASHDNAINFSRRAGELKYNARYDLNPGRNLYYVFVMVTDNREEAIAEAVRLRTETRYFDAWVYHGALGQRAGIADAGKHADLDPVTKEEITNIPEMDPSAGSVTALANEADRVSPDSIAAPAPRLAPVAASLTRTELAAMNFVFRVSRAVDGRTIQADIDVVDPEKSRKIAAFKANAPARVTAPPGKNARVSFICEVLGYRKLQKDFDFDRPSGEGIFQDDQGNIVVPFELVRLQKGDIAVMYNVFYFKDAAIMRPESRYEVNNLVDMLMENPNYRITLHGHTNGNSHGRMITMGDAKNFFSLTDSKSATGSAKKLSQARAETIQEYLVSEGIPAERIQIRAWGGKRPVHDKHSARARENVRVEVEIMSQ